MASAAAAKKCPRLFHRWTFSTSTSRRYASWTRAVAWSVWPGFSLRELLGGQLAQFVVDQGQELLGGLGIAVLDGREDARDVVHRREPLGRYRGKGPTPSPVARMASSPGPGDGESLPSGYPPRRRGDSQTQMASDFLATRLHFPPNKTHSGVPQSRSPEATDPLVFPGESHFSTPLRLDSLEVG